MPPKGMMRDPAELFWAKVQKTDTCWLWTAAIGRLTGYGQFCVFRRPIKAHRFAWVLTRGPIPDGLFVCHHCDVRHCVNPAHLWLGTNLENMRDAQAKGRLRRRLPAIGEVR